MIASKCVFRTPDPIAVLIGKAAQKVRVGEGKGNRKNGEVKGNREMGECCKCSGGQTRPAAHVMEVIQSFSSSQQISGMTVEGQTTSCYETLDDPLGRDDGNLLPLG